MPLGMPSEYYSIEPLLIIPNNKAMIAITSSMCIKPAAEYANTPINQPTIKTKAIRNNIVLITKVFWLNPKTIMPVEGHNFNYFRLTWLPSDRVLFTVQ